jgi:hypothetical protein
MMEAAMRIVSLLSGAVLVLLMSGGAAAQQVDVQAVRVAGGITYHGVVTESPDSITIELAAGGTLTLPRAQVRGITTVRGQLRDGEFWAHDLNETRLFFAPTARTLPRGAAYVSVYMFVLPFAGYGVSDAVTLAGGVLPFFGEGMPLIGYVAPKVQILANESVQAAVGALAFFSSEAAESAGILYGVTSFGRSSDASVSLGAGFGYAGSEMANTPVLMAGFETRTSRRTKLVSENWIFPRDGVILSFGPRFMGERMSGDFGIAMPLFGDGGFIFPMVNFVWNW